MQTRRKRARATVRFSITLSRNHHPMNVFNFAVGRLSPISRTNGFSRGRYQFGARCWREKLERVRVG